MVKRNGLIERVGSRFENGYGDEGLDAKIVHGAIIGGLMAIGTILWVIVGPVMGAKWLVRKLGSTGSTPSS